MADITVTLKNLMNVCPHIFNSFNGLTLEETPSTLDDLKKTKNKRYSQNQPLRSFNCGCYSRCGISSRVD